MGKYDSRIDIVDASMLDIVAKKWVANELAEMNRLKRLELKGKTLNDDWKIAQEELEDKA